MELDGNWLDSLLKRYAIENSPVRVTDFKIVDGVGKWENYLSKIKRINAKVTLQSGRTRNISLIVKDQHKTLYLKNMTQNGGFFFREIMMYRDVLPKMDDLIDEMSDIEGSMWAKCFGFKLYDQLVFEDLSASGYEVVDRKELMDLKTSKFVVRNLARFHALSKVLLGRGEIPQDVFGESNWVKNDTLSRVIPKYTSELVKAMENWGNEWVEAKDKLERSPNNLIEKFKNEMKSSSMNFFVLNHGDCWTNNFMFRYNKGSKKLSSMKFVDLQCSFIGSPAYDLHYFLVTSVKPDVQQESEDFLLECYSEALEKCLLNYGYKGSIPTIAELRKTMEETTSLRLVSSLIITPIVTGIHDDVLDLEELIANDRQAAERGEPAPQGWNVHQYKNELTKQLMQNSVKLAVKRNVI